MSLTGIVFLFVYFSGLLHTLISRPIVGLYIYFFTFYAHPPARWWGQGIPELRWSLIAAIVTLVAIIVKDRRNHGWLEKPEIKLFIAFVLFVWIQNFWAISSELQFEYSILVSKFLLLTYLFNATVKTINDLCGVLIVNIIGTGYYGWIGLSQHSGRFEDAGTPGMNDGNLLSVHMIPILIATSYILLCKYPRKFLLVPFIALTLNGIFLTQSRGAIVAIVLSGFIALWFVPKTKKKLYRVYSILAIVFGAIFVGPALVERLNTTVDIQEGKVEKSAESRIAVIKSQWEMFKNENPIIGNGHRGTLILSPHYVDETYLTTTGEVSVRASHNLVMAILVDQGLIGLILYFSLPLIIFRRLMKMKKFIKNDSDLTADVRNYITLYIGLNIALISMLVTSMGVNSLKLEIDIWLYSLLGISFCWLRDIKLKSDQGNK
jgi:O-antigen ligase